MKIIIIVKGEKEDFLPEKGRRFAGVIAVRLIPYRNMP